MMNYHLGSGDDANWLVAEDEFDSRFLGKAESILCLGNGYMGLRSATEEPYVGETRGLFVAGTFDKFGDEVTEIPNAADVTRIDISIDGQRLSLEHGSEDYCRFLNLRTAELTRQFTYTTASGNRLHFLFKRFVSMADRHLIGMKIEIRCESGPVRLDLCSGIDVRMSNSGSQHFSEGERRIYGRSVLQQVQTTVESGIDFVVSTVNHLFLDDEPMPMTGTMEMDRRKVWMHYALDLEPGQTLRLEKHATVATSRDIEFGGSTLEELKTSSLQHIGKAAAGGYDASFQASAKAWQKDVWDKFDIHIDSENEFDLLATRFAIYHMICMMPRHDERMGIAAKGLSGEGYKGHSFWDTELFVLPFFLYSAPDLARRLLKYRYLGLEGAHKKARENGYEGAMYPWEMAWPTDGEVTPVWGAVDLVTGKQTKIWSGFIEQHITADISYAVRHYELVTGDEQFMESCGYEMVIDAAIFWLSRLEWNAENGRYEITDVVGPDEYKEHANNNAFTNHMAHFNIELAQMYVERLRLDKPDTLARLSKRLDITRFEAEATSKKHLIYLPCPNEAGIIPQDDAYLSLKSIDLSKYKSQSKVGSLFYDYNLDQVIQMQITKQADVVMLLYLLADKFDAETVKKNFDYYEAHTLHDSSLSLSTHAILAADLGHIDMAYDLYQRALRIDLGENMKSSDSGIHAASIGGIWQAAIFGFAGIRVRNGILQVNPHLPPAWRKLSFSIEWQGARIGFDIDPKQIKICLQSTDSLTLVIAGQEIRVDGTTTVKVGD